jgi:septum formation protein
MSIILASTSPYRRRLLERLQLPFRCVAPNIEEMPLCNEQPPDMARRLAGLKAQAVAGQNPDALVIGSDQVASLEGEVMGKPGSFEQAQGQLRRSSGREVQFHTAIAVVCLSGDIEQFHVEPFSVHFRTLNDTEIENYLRRDTPYDCAGSFKVESLGIVLFERLTGDDPTSLEGLPLIKLAEILQVAGVDVLR